MNQYFDEKSVQSLVLRYSLTWRLLWQYDEDSLAPPKQKGETATALGLDSVRQAISTLRRDLMDRAEATDIFGNERGDLRK